MFFCKKVKNIKLDIQIVNLYTRDIYERLVNRKENVIMQNALESISLQNINICILRFVQI